MRSMSRLLLKCGLPTCICPCLSISLAKVLTALAHWMKKQSQEELEHAYTMADYVTKRGGKAKIDKIDVVPQGWGSPLEVFQHVYEHECKVSKMIDNLVSIASAEKDNATQDFLWGFVREQVEEEATAQGIVDKLKKAG